MEEQIRAEQIRTVYLHSPTTTIGSLVAGAFLVYVLWDKLPSALLLGWALVLCVHQAVRVYHYRAYVRDAAAAARSDHWGRLYIIATTVAGCIWGSTGILFYVPDSIVDQAYLCLILFGVASLTIPSISIFAPAFYPLVLLVLTPFIVRSIASGHRHEIALAIPLAIALAMAMMFGRKINLLVHDSIRRRFENVELIAELSRQKEIAEQARAAAEAANRSKTQFFAAASHDLRQPLHAMGLFAAALAEKIRDPEVLNVVTSINASVDALEGLFTELLDISKIDAGVIKPVPADFPINRVLDRLRLDFEPEAFEKGLRLKIRPSAAYVRTDPILLERVLRNLLSNAVRYTRAGGILVGCRLRGRRVRIEVWDTGVGIPAAERERIFEEFYQIGNPERASRRGLGLGLSIVKRLAALLGLDIRIDSRVGRGTVFRMTLAVATRPLVEDTGVQTTLQDQTDLSGRLIVVIDDEAPIVEGMSMLLRGWGAAVIASSSGDDVIDQVHAAGRIPDLIIADYRLAEGRVGTRVIEQLRRELDPEIPAILVTGSTTPDRVEEAKVLGYHLLLKPVLPAKLRTLINFKLRDSARAG